MKKKTLPFHLILLGQITSGKETQTELLKKKFNIKTVESGVFTRKMLKEKSSRGDAFRKTAGKGWAAPTKYMQQFFAESLAKCPKNSRLVFLGCPRLKPEAQLLVRLLKARKEKFFVFYITLPNKEVYRRSLSRSKSNVHALYKVFDEDKKIIDNRLQWHKEQVSKTVLYFDSLGVLKKINGNQSIQLVEKAIEKALYSFEKRI